MDYTNYRGFNLNETAFPVDKYGFKLTRWFWTAGKRQKAYQLTAGIVDDMLAKGAPKSELPTVDFKTNKQFAAVIADFDTLPVNFTSWTDFAQFLYKTYHTACITRSVSGRVKVIFLVQNMLHLDPAATLKTLIDPSLHEYLDLSPSALTQTFFNAQMYADLRKWLPTAIAHDPVGRSFEEITCDRLAQSYRHTITELSNLLSESGFNTKSFRSLTRPKLEQLATQLITSALDLCEDGCMWNQEIFAKVLGLKSPRTAAKILQKLEEVGFITMVSNYSAGNKSRTYAATGNLLEFFHDHGLHTTKAVETVGNVIKTHRINTLVASLAPPQEQANKYYVKIARLLIKYGVPVDSTSKILYDIDMRRPRGKQRPPGYFKYLSSWTNRKHSSG